MDCIVTLDAGERLSQKVEETKIRIKIANLQSLKANFLFREQIGFYFVKNVSFQLSSCFFFNLNFLSAL
jgi:hypothetical protein